MAEPENGSPPLAEALARVGDPRTLLVVEALPGGPQRFNDLLGQIPEAVSETAARRRGGGAIAVHRQPLIRTHVRRSASSGSVRDSRHTPSPV